MSWTLAVCIERNNVESEVVVPTKWIRNKWVYWSDSLHAKRDLENQVDVDESWPRFKLVKIKVSSGNVKLFEHSVLFVPSILT